MNSSTPLDLLVQQARDARDTRATEVRQCGQALQQAQGTLGHLQDFHSQLLQRSPVLGRACTATTALQDWQAFASGLQRALAQQAGEVDARDWQQAQAQRVLVEAQTRLLALQALQARRQGALERAAQRRQQHECDEFAARASQASIASPSSPSSQAAR